MKTLTERVNVNGKYDEIICSDGTSEICLTNEGEMLYKQMIQEAKLLRIKDLSNEFYSMISEKFDGLTNELPYKKASVFSYNKDRIELFINELNKFEL